MQSFCNWMYLSLSVCIYELPNELANVVSKYGCSIRPARCSTRTDTFDTHIYISKYVTFSLLDEFIADIQSPASPTK